MLPAELATLLDPAKVMERLGLDADDWQRDVLRSRSRRILLNCSRQVGKSTVAAALASHVARYRAGSLTLCVARAERQSVELLRKVKAALAAIGVEAAEREQDAVTSLELHSGSRVVALPGKEDTIRSFSAVNLLLVDEASRVADETYAAVRPMLAVSGGTLVALSTPYGKRGWWHREWADGGAEWQRYEVPATLCPRLAPDYLEAERRALGALFDQEYLCRFLDSDLALFSAEEIDAALDATLEPAFPLTFLEAS